MKLPAAEMIDEPTPEQAARVQYQRGEVRNEAGQRIGVAYRRKPLFETMTDSGRLAPDEAAALRYYRGAFDRCERSPTKSCLNITMGGGGRGLPAELANATQSTIEAKRRLRLCEAILGVNLATMRAVALEDRSFSDVAIERYGARRQNWIVVDEPVLRYGRPVVVDGKPQTRAAHREKIVPRSGRHREVIRAEFQAGVRALTDHVRALTNMGGSDELWVDLLEDGRASVVRGVCAPLQRYRWWGSRDHVAEVLYRVRQGREDLTFATSGAARAAVDAANDAAGLRLACLDAEELAA